MGLWDTLKKLKELKSDTDLIDFYENDLFQGRDDVWDSKSLWNMGSAIANPDSAGVLQEAWKNTMDPSYDRTQLQQDWSNIEKEHDFFQGDLEGAFLDRMGTMKANEWNPMRDIMKKYG